MAAIIVAISTVGLEYFLSIGLWFRKLMFPLMLLGVSFHAGLYYFLPITVFTVASVACYLAYMPPDVVHRFFDRLLGVGAPERKPDHQDT